MMMMIQADEVGNDVSEESGDDSEKEGACVKQNKVSEFVSS